VQGTLCGLGPGKSRDDPASQILRRQAAARRRDVAVSEEWLIEDLDAGILNPRFRD
jgi:hypothetical protein